MDWCWLHSPGLWTSSVESRGIIVKCTIPGPSCISIELEIECLEIFSSNNPPSDPRWCSQVWSCCLPRTPQFWCFRILCLLSQCPDFLLPCFPWRAPFTGLWTSQEQGPYLVHLCMLGTRDMLSKRGEARRERMGFPGFTTTYAHPSNFHNCSCRLSHYKSSDTINGKNTDFGT